MRNRNSKEQGASRRYPGQLSLLPSGRGGRKRGPREEIGQRLVSSLRTSKEGAPRRDASATVGDAFLSACARSRSCRVASKVVINHFYQRGNVSCVEVGYLYCIPAEKCEDYIAWTKSSPRGKVTPRIHVWLCICKKLGKPFRRQEVIPLTFQLTIFTGQFLTDGSFHMESTP